MYNSEKYVGPIGGGNEGIIIPGYFSILDLSNIPEQKTPGTTGTDGEKFLRKLGIIPGVKSESNYKPSILRRPNF